MYTIAVIEDEQLLRELMSNELRRSGYTVCEAKDGMKGRELLQEIKPDLVLLDLLMPRLSGYDLLKWIRSIPDLQQVPCIVISNSGQTDDLHRAYECGANDVLVKVEFTPDQVVNKVKAYLK